MAGQTVPDIMCNVCDDEDGLCGEGAGRTGDSLYDTLSDPSWCDCYTLQLTPDHLTTSTHDEYCQGNINWRPNLVSDRSQCTCYQPLDEEVIVYDDVAMDDLPTVAVDYKEDIEALGIFIDGLIQWEEDDSDTTSKKACLLKEAVYLTGDDFVDGTYRITECGHYLVSEDIVVNFNKPDATFDYEAGDSPNTYNLDNLHWFPTNAQQDSGEYFGLNAFWGPYSIGFMAAITIETSHVWLDLQGHSISMEYEFYLQQRFFAIIELGNKQFEARQGPVDFGRDDLCSKDISIRDGTLGLSSHHGIHGSCVKYVEISGLKIQNFDVTGIQCNGCKNTVIEDCVIGPQNTDIPVKGRYTHARIMLSRLRYLVDEYGSEAIEFANRGSASTMQQLADTLIEQMDMVYYHVMQGIEFDDSDAQWRTAKHTFLNPTGWMDGGSSYGILLNGYGTAVVNIGRRTTGTFNIAIKNVEIFGIKVKPHEGFWASTPNEDGGVAYAIVHGFFFETIDWNYGNVYDHDTGYYLGDAYTDILFAANTFLQDDFCPLGSLFYLQGLADWVFNDETDLYSPDVGIRFSCGSDIQSHSAKGAIGIRIDGVDDFSVEDVYIHDIVNWGNLGSDHCGEYENVVFEEGVDVDKDIQYGYTGHKVHGILTDYASGSIKNIKIEKLDSHYGSANAIALYKGTTASLAGYIDVNHVVAGSKLTKDEAMDLVLPNPVPFVCSIFIGPNSDADAMPQLTPTIDSAHALSFASFAHAPFTVYFPTNYPTFVHLSLFAHVGAPFVHAASIKAHDSLPMLVHHLHTHAPFSVYFPTNDPRFAHVGAPFVHSAPRHGNVTSGASFEPFAHAESIKTYSNDPRFAPFAHAAFKAHALSFAHVGAPFAHTASKAHALSFASFAHASFSVYVPTNYPTFVHSSLFAHVNVPFVHAAPIKAHHSLPMLVRHSHTHAPFSVHFPTNDPTFVYSAHRHGNVISGASFELFAHAASIKIHTNDPRFAPFAHAASTKAHTFSFAPLSLFSSTADLTLARSERIIHANTISGSRLEHTASIMAQPTCNTTIQSISIDMNTTRNSTYIPISLPSSNHTQDGNALSSFASASYFPTGDPIKHIFVALKSTISSTIHTVELEYYVPQNIDRMRTLISTYTLTNIPSLIPTHALWVHDPTQSTLNCQCPTSDHALKRLHQV
eukprot:432852_1